MFYFFIDLYANLNDEEVQCRCGVQWRVRDDCELEVAKEQDMEVKKQEGEKEDKKVKEEQK